MPPRDWESRSQRCRCRYACVWVQAPSASAAVELAAKRLGHMGGWRTGHDVDQEVFAAEEYREHAQPGTTRGP